MRVSIKKALLPVLPVAVLLLTVLGCLWLNDHDNKYTHPGPQASQGILLLDEGLPKDGPVLYLTEGWAYYADRLLTPGDFETSPPVPDEYLFLGQYGGLDRDDFAASPHGSASYRLRIQLPEEPRQYLLELPEIFSAYRLYINGREVAGMGVPEADVYRPSTGNRAVSLEASGTVELLVAVSDYTHFYSGMVYPPAFGEPNAVSQLLGARLLFRSILCTAAGVIGVLAVLVGLLSRKGLPFRYGLLCLGFIGYAGYPIWRSFISWYGPLYLLENLCFCAVLLLAVSIQCSLLGRAWKRRWGLPFLGLGSVMMAFTLVVHATLSRGNLQVMAAYSTMIALYQWTVAAFLTATSLVAVWRRNIGSLPMLCGILILDGALAMDRVLPLFEPMVTGWFGELAVFALIACIGVVTGGEVAGQYRQGAVLAERIHSTEQLLRMQQTYHSELMRQAEETRIARHDLHHHFAVMKTLLGNQQYGQLQSYLEQYGGAIPSHGPGRYCEHPIANAIADYYMRVAMGLGITLTMGLDIEYDVFLSDTELGCILSNLLENAVEACQRLPAETKRRVTLHANSSPTAFALHMENSAVEIRQVDSHIFSAKGENRQGYGLRSVQAIVNQYGGESEFRFEQTQGIFISTLLLPELSRG